MSYPTDVSDEDWSIIEPILLGVKKASGRPRKYAMRSMFNAICYICKAGGQWALLPNDLPPYKQVHEIYMKWIRLKVFEEINKAMHNKYSKLLGKPLEASKAIVDSKTVQTVFNHDAVGVDGHKKNKGQ